MRQVVDVVNFNADASCLSAARWLEALAGGEASELCAWLRLYVELDKRVSLGFVGGALADVAILNPEAIAVVREHPQLFEPVLRPFAHDVALLRSASGFVLNLSLGRDVIERELGELVNIYLPPEFMLTGAQIKQLVEQRVAGVFINPARFKDELQARLPDVPYLVEGVMGSRLPCVPFHGALTQAYLDSLHRFDGAPWAAALDAAPRPVAFSWRDGESCLLLPDGVARERAWLEHETSSVERVSLRETVAATRFCDPAELPGSRSRAYPVHSFTSWFKEFRMLGFVQRLARLEERLDGLGRDRRLLWLQTIGSDVLSAVEKDSPSIKLCDRPGGALRSHTLWRTERGFEGEDTLALLESALVGQALDQHLEGSAGPHLRKVQARLSYARKWWPDG